MALCCNYINITVGLLYYSINGIYSFSRSAGITCPGARLLIATGASLLIAIRFYGSCSTQSACHDLSHIIGEKGARQLGTGDDEEEEQADPGGQGRQGGRQEAHQERRYRRHSGRKPCISYAKG